MPYEEAMMAYTAERDEIAQTQMKYSTTNTKDLSTTTRNWTNISSMRRYDEIPVPLDDELVDWGTRKVAGRAVIKAEDYSRQDTVTVYVAVRDEDIISEKFFFGYVAEYGTAKILRHKEGTVQQKTEGFVKKMM